MQVTMNRSRRACGASLDVDEFKREIGVPLVLVAEDDEEMRKLLTSVLRKAGYEVEAFGDGVSLVQRLVERREPGGLRDVAAVVCDVRMPRATGLDVLAYLRRWDRSTPVVLITAFGDSTVHLQALKLGAAATLDKPFAMQDFRAKIHEVTGGT